MRWIALWIVMFAAIAPAILAGEPISKAKMAMLIRSLNSDDSNERLTAVVTLSDNADQAKPALPALKAAYRREEPGDLKKLMAEAIKKIEEASK
jgi:hypothetical protein